VAEHAFVGHDFDDAELPGLPGVGHRDAFHHHGDLVAGLLSDG